MGYLLGTKTRLDDADVLAHVQVGAVLAPRETLASPETRTHTALRAPSSSLHADAPPPYADLLEIDGLVFVVEDKDTASIIAQRSIPGYDAAVYTEGKGYITSYQTCEAGIRVPQDRIASMLDPRGLNRRRWDQRAAKERPQDTASATAGHRDFARLIPHPTPAQPP
ncbi:hypothetical protein N7527_010224 [Penicillium freii]|uniref:Uncharacterized protein n=1 Tax=Penicillium freii TaxID=48697 RepID=A0A101MFY4_PENFR|nr:hypothetical protein N7527_010224 [Penicillium freii]KUM59698.1 hypothetical protein ACN42_g7433 [Penicillium freii]